MASSISITEKTWRQLIAHVLRYEHLYTSYSEEDLSWLQDSLYTLFTNNTFKLTATSIYRCLVLLDKGTAAGRYALIFNSTIQASVRERNFSKLEEICKSASFPELEALSPEAQARWQSNINRQMLEYNLYTDREMLATESRGSLEEKLKLCYQEICNYKLESNAKYISCHTSNTVLLSGRDATLKKVWSIREIDLLFLVLSNGNNPFTDKPLSEHTRNVIMLKYKETLQICQRAHKLGYRHQYRL